ncbi:MAG: porin [Rubritalea sp.]|uniref:porin n=1 Tax=Rubritalea sp. TaxID=2109375 RepID=UPI0032422A15
MNNKVVSSMISAAALTGSAYAGPAPVVVEEKSNCGSWCDTLETIGTVYKNKENPYIQKVKFFGRAQVQYGYVDGKDSNGDSFNQDFDEFRRLRFGGEVKFLNGFKLKANANFVLDEKPKGGEREFGYQSFDQAKLSYTFKDLFSIKESTITYGRYKVAVGAEQHASSKKIKTVERSALANKLTTGRPTGASIDLKNDGWSATLGVFSNDYQKEQDDLLTGWGESVAIYASTKFDVSSGGVILDVIYNDQQNTDDPFLYKWATSAAYLTSYSDWDLTFNAILGDNGDFSGAQREGLFYGFTALGSKDIIKDKLEFVARYSYQGSEGDEGVRLNSRYVRRASRNTPSGSSSITSGRGDQHHALYGGLNWYLCGDQSKFMTGLEYDNLDASQGSNIAATTIWAAYRMYF